MAQIIDIKYQEKAKSQPLNKRFMDITGPYVSTGFRLQKGGTDFSLNIVRGGYNSSVAVTPSGARVEETTDLFDRVSIRPNDLLSGSPRADSIFLKYVYGTQDAVAEYVVVEGKDTPPPNPNVNTHLLIGHVYVFPNNQILRNADIISVPYGFSSLEIAGRSKFNGPAEFNDKVTFKAAVEFLGGTGGDGNADPSFVDYLPTPIIATAGQTTIVLPSTYTMNSKTLFVFKDGEAVPPSEFYEVDNKTFRFFEGLKEGAQIWAFWYRNLTIYTEGTHNHDDLYYRKYEIANRAVRYATDYFAGSTGRSIKHYLSTLNYHVISVIPVEKTNALGEVSVEKREDEIIVYNTGTYRGKFDISYIIKAPYDVSPTNEQYGDYSIESLSFDTANSVYTVTNYKRKDGTLYMKTTLLNINASGKYTRLRQDYYNTTGTSVIESKTWALTYDSIGNVTLKTRIV